MRLSKREGYGGKTSPPAEPVVEPEAEPEAEAEDT